MNRPLFTSASNFSNNRQPLSQAPATKTSIHGHLHSGQPNDPQDYQRQPPPPPTTRYNDDDDTEEVDEGEEDIEMTAYPSRTSLPNAASSNGNSRPESSPKESGPAVKKPKTKSTKVFQCTGYGDCNMQFTRSEHLARHIRKHTGERPFHCDCGRNFSRLDNLRQHMTTVHAQQYPPPSSNAPPARQPPQAKPSGGLQLGSVPHRPGFKNKHRPGPLTLPAQGYSNRSPPGSPRYKAYSATAAQFPVTYHDPPPSPLATASGNFSGTNPSWHRAQSVIPAIGPLSDGSSTSSGSGSTSSYFSGHLSPPATGTFPPSPTAAYFGAPPSATYIMHNHISPGINQHPSYDDKASRRQSWHEGSNGNKLPSIRTIWTPEDSDSHRPPFSPNNFNTSYLRSPISSKDDRRNQREYSPTSRRSSLPPQPRPSFEPGNKDERTPEEDDDHPMRNGVDRQGPNTPTSVDEDSMDIDSRKITSIADLCHPDRGNDESNSTNRTNMGGGNSGMDLLSQAAAALIEH